MPPVSPVVDRRVRIAGFDGLRALAVTAVVLTHAQVNRGGWIGVDTFFVLSGFLIASLLVSDLGQNRPMRDFWMRRARRLLPAFLLMVMVVCGLMLLEIVEVVGPQGQPFTQAFWSVLYVGNWYEVVSGSNYWTQFGHSPFGHLWSLGIEEQFYLLFPLVMWLAWRARRVSTVAVLGVLTVASGAWSLWLGISGASQNRIYYGTDTRAFALLCGATAAVALTRPGAREWLEHRRRGLGVVGVVAFVAVVLGATFVDGSSAVVYHGGLQVASLVELALVVSVAVASPPALRFLGWKPLVWIGGLSYGIYLWHMPVFAFLPLRFRSPWATMAVGVPIAIALAAISYRFVESPFRFAGRRPAVASPRRARTRITPARLVVASFVLCALGLGYVVVNEEDRLDVVSASTGPVVLAGTELAAAAGTGDLGAVTKAAQPVHRLMVLGDSVALTLVNSVKVEGVETIENALLGCSSLNADQNFMDGKWLDRAEGCRRWREQEWPKRLATADATLWVWGAWDLADVRLGGRELVVGTPEYREYMKGELASAADVLTAGGRRLFITSSLCYHDGRITDTYRRAQTQNEIIREFAASRDDVSYLPLIDLVCSGSQLAKVNGAEPRPDGVHFSADASRVVWSWLMPYLTGKKDPEAT